MITEKSNQLQVIMITDYNYPISDPDGSEKKSSIQRVKYGTIIKCEGIINAILEKSKT